MKEKSAGENIILYVAGAFLLFVFASALFGFSFMGFIGESGKNAGVGFKVLAVVLFVGAVLVLIRANNTGKSGIGTYLLAFALTALAIWSAMGFAS